MNVRVEERCDGCECCCGDEDEDSRGGDMRERIKWRDEEPSSARPYMYPKCTFPEKSKKVPKRRKKRMGPARSESSIMCWSIEAKGLSTANVYFHMLAFNS